MISLLFKAMLDGSQYEAGLRKITGITDRASAQIRNSLRTQVGAAIGAGALTIAAKQALDYGSKVDDLSKRLGVSAGAIQEWDYALSQSGGTLEDVTPFIEKLRRTRLDPDLRRDFEQLGVSAEMLKSARVEDIFKRIAETLKGADPEKFSAALQNIGGKGSGALMAAFVSGFADAGEEARKLGLILEDEVIKKLDAAGDKIDQARRKLRVPVAEATGFAAGKISDAIDFIGDTARIFGAASAGGNMGDVVQSIQQEIPRARSLSPEAREAMRQKQADLDYIAKVEAQERAAAQFAAREIADAEKVLAIREQILDVQAKSGTEEEKKARLQAKILELEKRMDALVAIRASGMGDVPASEIAGLELERAKVAGELEQMDKRQPTIQETFSAMDKIGLHGLGGPRPEVELSKQQLAQLREISRNTNPDNASGKIPML